MSADFDPRLIWTRRQMMAAGAALTAASAGAAQACDAERAGRGGAAALLVTDSGIEGARARRMAHLAGAHLAAIPERADTLRFWTGALLPRLQGLQTGGAPVIGLTRWADYLILRGAAAESGLRARFEIREGAASGQSDHESALRAVVEAAQRDAAGRIGWILA